MSSSGWSGFMQKSQKQQSKSQSKSKPRASNSKKRKLSLNTNNDNELSNSRPTKRRKLSNTIQHVQCPMCNKQILSHLVNFHMEEHFLKQTPSKISNNSPNPISTTTSKPPQSTTNNNASKSQIKSKESKPKAKICPLFTSGALPSSMFAKAPKKRSSAIPAQEAIFCMEITTNETDQQITSWNAQWIDTPSQITPFISTSKEKNHFVTDVMIKEPNTIGPTKVYLICNYPSRSDGPMPLISHEFKFNHPSPNRFRFSPSLCKSLLQKCVRVSHHQSAVKAAYLLMLKDSLQGLLRRLSVIIIEDAILIKDFVLLMWLLLSESKSNTKEKYHPSICWYNFVFSLVNKCGKCQVKDYMDYTMHPTQEQYINLFTPMDGDDDDAQMKQLLIRTMLMRASYGGMKCDVAMLRSFACIWHNRFYGKNAEHCAYYERTLASLRVRKEIEAIVCNGNRSEIQEMIENNDWFMLLDRLDEASMVQMKEIAPIVDSDLILSAVDFHCSNMLSVLCDNGNGRCWAIVREYLNGNSNQNAQWRDNVEGLLKLLIWEFRSSKTNKIGLLMKEQKPEELRGLWTNIKAMVNDFSLTHIKSRTRRY